MKVVIGGYYGAGNLGDELLLGLLIGWLKAESHDVLVVTLDDAHTKALHRTAAINRCDFPELLKQISGADVFILGGGGLFQDHHRFTISDLYTYPAPGISYYAQLCLLARQLRVPYMLFAMGVGPLRCDDARNIVREIFGNAAYVSVRDQASAALLKEIGVDISVDIGADPGWLTPEPVRIALGQRYPCLSGRSVLVVTPREWPFAGGWRQALAEGLAESGNEGWSILWLSFQSSPFGNDAEIIESLRRQLGPNIPQVVVHSTDPSEAAQIIASADALVAMRLHALVLGLKSSVPTLAVEYDEKLAFVSEAVRLPAGLRLKVMDPASRFCDGVRILIGLANQWPREISEHVNALRYLSFQTRTALLYAIGQLPSHIISQEWNTRDRNWIMSWLSQRLTEKEKQVADLSDNNSRQAEQIEAIHKSWEWRLMLPFRLFDRAADIVSVQGWGTLMKKLNRALERYVLDPLIRRLIQPLAILRLHAILRAHKGKTPIVFRPIIGWNLHLFQRPQQLAVQMANCGYLYFYCFPINNRDSTWLFSEVSPGCFVTPHFELVEKIAKKIVHLYSTDSFCTIEWVRHRIDQGDKILYEYVDEIHEAITGFPIPKFVFDRHNYILQNEEIACVATADKLYRDVLSVRNLNCGLITNGVDIEHFSGTRDELLLPVALKDIVSQGRSIIGYFGALAKWFDYELVKKLAIERPAYEIVLIGPDYDGSLRASIIDRLPNVTLLGPLNYELLPSYARWFDVATIPFKINEVTESTSPIKLFEYMALGHPIVTTDMPECRKYKSVLIGKDADQFIEQIDKALQLRHNSAYQLLLRHEAEQNSWASKAEALVNLLKKSE